MQSATIAAPVEAASASRAQWGIVGGHAFKHIFNSGFAVILPEIKASLGLSNAAVGTLATVRSVVGGAANAPAGYIADRYGGGFAWMLAGTLALLGLFQLGLGFAANFLTAIVFATLANVLFTFWHPPAIGTLSKLFPRKRGLVIALHGTGASIGETLGPLLVGGLLTVVTWQTALRTSVVPAVIAALIVWFATRSVKVRSRPVSARGYFKDYWLLLRSRKLLLVLAIACGFSASQAAVLTFLPVYVREDLRQSTWMVGVYVAIAQGAGIVTLPLMGRLLDRVGRKAIIAPSLFALTGALALLYVSGGSFFFIVGLALTGAFIYSITALLTTAACDVTADHVQGTTVALVYTANAAFTVLGPFVSGFIADATSVRDVFLFSSAATLVSAVLASVTRWERARA